MFKKFVGFFNPDEGGGIAGGPRCCAHRACRFYLWEFAGGISSPSVFPRDFPAVTCRR
jgi:hypothetical protein